MLTMHTQQHSLRTQKDEELAQLQQKVKLINEISSDYQSLAATAQDKLLNVIRTANSLQEKMTPINEKIKVLNEKRQGYESCKNFLQQAKVYQYATDKLRGEISHAKITNVDNYILSLSKAKESYHFYATYLPNEKNASNLHYIIDNGTTNLVKLFEEKLTFATRPYSADKCISLVDNPETKGSLTFLDENTLSDFYKIMKWLDGEKKTSEYMSIFIDCRGQMLLNSLSLLKDGFQSSSSASLPYASSPMTNRKGQSKETISKKKPPLHRRIPFLTLSLYEDPMSKKENLLQQSPLWDIGESSDVDPDDLNRLLCVFFTICEIEFDFVKKMKFNSNLTSTENSQAFYDKLITPARNFILNEVSNFVGCVRARMKLDPLVLLNLIAVVNNLRLQQENIGIIFCRCSPDMLASFEGALFVDLLKRTLGCLEDLRDAYMMDPRLGDLPMPPDGTVHQVSSQAMKLLEAFHDFGDTAYEILMRGQTITGTVANPLPPEQVPDKDKAKVIGGYLSRCLANLLRSIEAKSETVDDRSLRFVFLLNNYHYIYRRLFESNMIPTMEAFNCDTIKFFEENQKRWRQAYLDTSLQRLATILSPDIPVAQSSVPNPSTPSMVRKHFPSKHAGAESIKLTDKEKSLIKDKFRSFNEEFLSVHKLHRTYSVPDRELRNTLIKENKDFLMEKYRMFREKYENVPFSSKKQTYIRFGDLELENLLEEFFLGD